MRVAVTGANGFVGRAVVSALVGAGRDVVAVTRAGRVPGVDTRNAALDRRTRSPPRSPTSTPSATSPRSCGSGLLADPLGAWRTNLGGTLAVLGALRPGARIVLASTAAINDDHRPPAHPYGAAKLAADLAARDATVGGALGAISLRLANVAGPGDADRTRLVPAILAAASEPTGEFVVNGDGSAVRGPGTRRRCRGRRRRRARRRGTRVVPRDPDRQRPPGVGQRDPRGGRAGPAADRSPSATARPLPNPWPSRSTPPAPTRFSAGCPGARGSTTSCGTRGRCGPADGPALSGVGTRSNT